ncbi:unnamed protein product [Rotaria sordida]|uniref:protein kinase C n=1 Tax=Rotaria sordida TaxID=392033 RepID=A0A819C844_9BILA|nr:unnamed protein product [Rotaria sordida]
MNNFEYQERVGMFNDVLMCNSADLNLPFDIYKLFDENENLADQYADLNEVSSNIDKIGLEMAQHNKESFHTLKFTKEEFYRHIDSFKFHLQQDIQKARDPKIAKKIENERKLFLHIPGHDLIQEEQIGQGGYADVYHGKWLSRHHDVAIKVIRVNNITDIVKQGFLKEITTMYQIRYEHVLNVLGACIESNYYALVMEYMSLGSLYDLLKNKEQTLSWPIRWSLALQMTKGINCLHMMSILHRDIKSSNFLIEMAPNGYLVKVADFSLAQIRSESSRQSISNTSRKIPSGTLRWTAPELFANGKSSMASDVYSLGMAFWEVATRCIPYEDANDIIIVTTVSVGNRPPIPADVPSTFAAIIFDSWNQEPSRRPTCQELIRRLETNASIFQSGNAITPYPTTTTNVLCQMPLPQYTNNTPYESKTLQTSYGWKKETSKIEDEQARRVTLAIHDLMLYNNCPIYDDDDYANIFISINFLNYPPEERETPEALPKKRPFTVYCFNFQKDYFVHNPEQQAQLAKLISFDSSGDDFSKREKANYWTNKHHGSNCSSTEIGSATKSSNDTSGTTSNLQASLQPQSSHFLTNDNDNNEIQGTDIDLLALYTKLTLNHNNEPRATSRSSTPVSRISLSDNSNRASRLRLAAIRARINANSNPHRPRRPRADAKIKNRRPSTPARSK